MEKASKVCAKIRILSTRKRNNVEKATQFSEDETILGVYLAKRVNQEAETDSLSYQNRRVMRLTVHN